MQKITYITISLFLLLFACKSDGVSNDSDKHKKSEIEIPEVLKRDTSISKHLSDLSSNLDEFAFIIEDIADGIDAIGIKDIKKPSITEKLQLMKILMPKVNPIMEKVEKIQKLDIISETIKDTLAEDKKIAFEAFEEKFKQKFDTLQNRFQSYMK